MTVTNAVASLRLSLIAAACLTLAACGGGSMPDDAVDAAADTPAVATPDASTSQVNPGVRSRRTDANPDVGG
jgi:hypothetical protein